MFFKAFAAACALASIGGCAGRPMPADLPLEHPANPAAASGPATVPSMTLAVAPAASTPERSGAAHDHASMGGKTPPATQSAAPYACPHHPEVTADRPDQRCPTCNMKLVRMDAPDVPAEEHEGHR